MKQVYYVIDTGGDGHFSVTATASTLDILKTVYQSAATTSDLEQICVSVRVDSETLGRFVLPDYFLTLTNPA